MSEGATTASSHRLRLNRLIELWEQDKPAFGSIARFRDPDGAAYYAASQQDFVIFDLEHVAADFTQLRIFLQFMLDRDSLLKKGNPQPNVVPLVRIPPNGAEHNQWLIKQAFDVGAYGILAPHIKSHEDALALVSSARYPHKGNLLKDKWGGQRGVSPFNAARYWGISGQEYMERADTWPLDPQAELAIIVMIESREAVDNVENILKNCPGIAAVLVGAFDLSSSLGHPGQMAHPETERAIESVLATTRSLRVPCGVPVSRGDIEKRLQQGFRFLIAAGTPGEIEDTVRFGRKLSGRD